MTRLSILAGTLALLTPGIGQQPGATGVPDAPSPQQTATAQAQIPDAPKPQTTLPPAGAIAPGIGTAPLSATQDASDPNAPGTSLPNSPPATHADDGSAPDLPVPGEGTNAFKIIVGVNFVEVPFTVKDNKGRLVPGITWRDVRVYENGTRQQMRLFTVDPFPLSVALVIDQSVTFDTMAKINNALGAIQGAFTTYDEVAVITYNNGPKLQNPDFLAGQSARLQAVIDRAKSTGREGAMNYTSGPLSQNININDNAQSHIMPNVNPSHGTSQSNQINVPREVHTLNDAIFEAAKQTTRAGRGRRRIVYVISDGKEYGSTVKQKELIRYLQTNQIAVYATLVHDLPTIPGTGFMNSLHLPLQMRDNILPVYANATGGQIDPEFRQKGIEQSFARITEEVRTQYTVGYYSHEPFIDGKYRTIEVKVLRPNLDVIAKKGYYPLVQDARPATIQAAQ